MEIYQKIIAQHALKSINNFFLVAGDDFHGEAKVENIDTTVSINSFALLQEQKIIFL